MRFPTRKLYAYPLPKMSASRTRSWRARQYPASSNIPSPNCVSFFARRCSLNVPSVVTAIGLGRFLTMRAASVSTFRRMTLKLSGEPTISSGAVELLARLRNPVSSYRHA